MQRAILPQYGLKIWSKNHCQHRIFGDKQGLRTLHLYLYVTTLHQRRSPGWLLDWWTVTRFNTVVHQITVTSLIAVDGKQVTQEVLVEGWLAENNKAWGRPADLLQLADGSVLIADDKAGVIYRLSYADPILGSE
jgi:hypothetical protein